LFPRVVAWENLLLAYRKASRGKRGRSPAASFEFQVADRLLELQDELVTDTYRPGPYRHFIIHEPKRRRISAAPFRDRVVHHALCNVIEPLFEARFYPHSYANRVGKGTHRAIDQLQAYARRYRYVLRLDVVQHFPSLDHAVLKRELFRVIDDERVRRLIDVILAGGEGVLADEYDMVYFDGDDLLAIDRPRGLPIGNLTSQFWANVYLHELDMFVKHELRSPAYLRYMDDFVLFADDKDTLHGWKEAIHAFLASRLRLELHPKKGLLFPVQVGLEFCGFRIYPTHRRLRRAAVRRFVGRFRQQRAAYRRGELPLDKMTESVRCWIAHAAHGDTWRLRRRLFADYPLVSP
jgi:retron-type reverse transcriptase